jgi:mannose-6-phosphate isomerase-like protein (cupin superfamily)
MKKVIFSELLEKIREKWEPADVAFINDTALRIAKVDGAYDWHTHPAEDEFFLALEGKIFIDTEATDGTVNSVELNRMEGFLVKRGIKHRSRTNDPAWVLLVEPTRTNTKGVK